MDCFKKLTIGLPDDHKIFKEYLNFDYGQVEVPNKIYDKSKTFKQYEIPDGYFDDCSLGEIIKDLNLRASIFLIEGNHFYNWHRDAWRNFTINLTLNYDSDYLVLFAHDANQTEPAGLMMYEPYTELKYDYKKFVLLNTQVPHITITQGPVNRYLLTVAHYSGEPSNSLKKLKSDFSEFEKISQYFKDRNLTV
jgi:hypothetical protein